MVSIWTALQIILIIIAIGGSATVSILTAGVECLINKRCNDFFMIFGSSIFSPQKKISDSVDTLTNQTSIQAIPTEYRDQFISNQRQQIILGIIVSIFWFYIAYKVVDTLPALKDIGTKIIIFGFVVLFIGMVHSMYSYFFEGSFVIPWFGFIKLAMHPDIFTATSAQLIGQVQNLTVPG